MACFSGAKPIDAGLVLSFDFGNLRSYPGTGTAINNLLTSTGGVATFIGTPVFSSSNLGQLTFDGSTNCAIFNKALSSFSIGDTYTFEVISKRPVNSPNGKIVWGAQGFNYGILTTVNNKFTASEWYSNNAGGWLNTSTNSTTTLLPDVWYHTVMTFNSSSNINLYINGILEGSTVISSFTASSTNTWFGRTSALCIAGGSSNLYRFQGSVAMGRLYNRDLSAAEIKQNYEVFRSRYGM